MMAEEDELRYRFGLSFSGQIQLRRGGAFSPLLGLLDGQSQTVDMRRLVKQVADLMLANCDNDRGKVLYDDYHGASFAKADLIEQLPPMYRKCELVVVFLCKDYAAKHWPRREWDVIKELARDRQRSHRVMFLWHGDRDDQVLKELELDWNRDGFLRVDGMEASEIWRNVHTRYMEEDPNRLCESSRHIICQPATVDSSLDDKAPILQERFLASSWLIHPKGESSKETASSKLDSSSGSSFSLDELAAKILYLYKNEANKLEEKTGDASFDLLVVLLLPAELIASPGLHHLLGLVREGCQAREDWPAMEPPPIVLTCTERVQAGVLSAGPALESDKSLLGWLEADRKAQRISKEIVGLCGGSGALRDLSWWMFHDEPPGGGTLPSPGPRHFEGAEGGVRPGCELEQPDQPLCVVTTMGGAHQPQSLYLSWGEDLPRKQPHAYNKRMHRILKAGVPLFLMDRPGLAADGGPSWGEPAKDEGHPLDGVLGWSHAELIRNVCQFHKMIQQPSSGEEARRWAYVRGGILFRDDHRYRVPLGPDQGPAASQGRSDALIAPLHS
jgi:hypothetical protein